MANHKGKRHFAETTISPGVSRVDLEELHFAPGSPAAMLDRSMDMARILSGEVPALFAPVQPVTFQSTDRGQGAPRGRLRRTARISRNQFM